MLDELNRLVGKPQALEGRVEVRPGEALLILRNNRPEKILANGDYRRGWGLPLTGRLVGVPLITGPISVHHTVGNVETALEQVGTGHSRFKLPQVTVDLTIQLDPGYRSTFLDDVATDGFNLASVLRPKVQSAVEKLVRDRLSRFTHDALSATPNRTGLFELGEPLLDGLFRLRSVTRVDWVQDPDHETITRGPITGLIGLVELTAALERAHTLHIATGLPMAALLEPEVWNLGQERVVKVIGILAEHPRGLGTEEIRGLAAQILTGDPRTTLDATPAAAPGLPGHAAVGTLATPTLRTDPTFDRVWGRFGLDSQVTGAGAARSFESAVVVGVFRGADLVWRQLPDVQGALRDTTGQDTELCVLEHAPTLVELVRAYFAQRVPELRQAQPTYALTQRGEELHIALGLPDGSTRAMRRAILEPDAMVLEPFRRMLPYDVVHVDPLDA